MSMLSRVRHWFVGKPEADAPNRTRTPASRHDRREAGRERHHKTGEPAWEAERPRRQASADAKNPDAAPEILGAAERRSRRSELDRHPTLEDPPEEVGVPAGDPQGSGVAVHAHGVLTVGRERDGQAKSSRAPPSTGADRARDRHRPSEQPRRALEVAGDDRGPDRPSFGPLPVES